MRLHPAVIALLGALTVVFAGQPALAQELTPKAALERFLTAPALSAAWFTEGILAQVPLAQLDQARDALVAQYGEFSHVEERARELVAVYARFRVPVLVALDARGRFSGLLFQVQRAEPVEAPVPGRLAEQLAGLPGTVSALARLDGKVLLELLPGERLAVGSTFKLVVLAALRDEVNAGRRSWSEVVTLRDEWRSLPSGRLQEWPAGSPLTLHTLAALMISESDNTAADALIAILGRELIERKAPVQSRPLLTTREAFLLKDPRNAAELSRYRAGDEAARRAILGEIAGRPLPGADLFAAGRPVAIDVEWFFTARELCALAEEVYDLELTGINPGITDRSAWRSVAFKGGSEPGVLNLTTRVQREDGRAGCVAITWVEPGGAIDQTRLVALYQEVLGLLR